MQYSNILVVRNIQCDCLVVISYKCHWMIVTVPITQETNTYIDTSTHLRSSSSVAHMWYCTVQTVVQCITVQYWYITSSTSSTHPQFRPSTLALH